MYKQSSQTSKYILPKISNNKRITTPKNNFKKFKFDLNNKFTTKNSICEKHREPFINFCQNCNCDLCEYCVFTHDNNHILIKYSNIIPEENEINLLKETLKNFSDNYTKLLNEIKKWKNDLEEILDFIEKEIDKNEVLGNINFVNNFDNIEINFKNIFKFRKIFLAVLGGGSGIESRKNSGIMDIIDIYKNDINNSEQYNMGFYNYTQNNISKALLDLLLNNNIDNSFIYKGNLIIKYLWECFINLNNSKSNSNINRKVFKKNSINNKKYDTNTYSGSLRYDKDEDIFINDNNDINNSNKSKIIEKHIDLKKGSKRKNLNLKRYNTNTYDINNNSQIYNNFNRTMSTFFSSKNLMNNISKNNLGNNKGIYLKKKCNLNTSNIINNNWSDKLNQTAYNIRSQFDLDNNEENNKVNDSEINQKLNMKINNPFKQKRNINKFGRTNSLNYINNNKTFDAQNISDKELNFNLTNKNEIITSKFIPEIKVRNLIFNKNSKNTNNNMFDTENNNLSKKINSININTNKVKTFKHKKLEPNIENNFSSNSSKKININNLQKEKEDINKLNQTQLYNKLNETSFQEESLNNSNILNTTYNQAYSNNYYSLNKNVIISQKKQESNTNIQFISNINSIKSTLFQQQLNINNNNNNSTKIQVRKNNFDTKYVINPNLPLCISLELDNDFCKICVLNQVNQEIELFSFGEGLYTIPMIISFNEKNEIIIGQEAEQIITLNPERTFFNLLKMFGKKFDEIKGMKELWPFKIYKDEKNRPFFWINLGKNSKKFYAEDLLSIYLKKLFKIFFKKIICEENLDDNFINLNIILVISIPNNFTYLQRKALEKIFEKQIFPSEPDKEKENNSYLNNSNNNESNNSINGIKLYNNYLVNLKQIKIENVSSIASLCLKPSNKKNKNNTKPTNSLIINIGGAHTNISIASYPSYKNKSNTKNFSKKKYFSIKSISSIELGSQDFTDIFVSDCLKEFDQNLLKQCLETPSALAKLRKSCNTAEKIFGENSHVEIKVNKLYETMNLKMILNKIDYEKVCENLYKEIILEIKKVIKEAKLSEINIDNILLMGNISRSDSLKNMLKTMFKHNRLIFNQLSNSSNNSDINNNDFYSVIGGAIQSKNYIFEESLNLDNDIEDIFSLNDITPMSFGVETINGLMEFVIEKGTNLPVQKNKCIKIKNDGEKFLEIKIYEGEDNNVIKNKLISEVKIDKRNFKNEKVGNNYIEILIQFEISSELNLCVYVLDSKTMKRRFECLINIDVIKS